MLLCIANYVLVEQQLQIHGVESRDLRILKNGGLLSKPLDSGKTLFDISVNTDQIGMGFITDTPGK